MRSSNVAPHFPAPHPPATHSHSPPCSPPAPTCGCTAIILYNLWHRDIPTVKIVLNGDFEDLEAYAHRVGARPCWKCWECCDRSSCRPAAFTALLPVSRQGAPHTGLHILSLAGLVKLDLYS